MAESLRDQLLKSGLVQKLKTETSPVPKNAPSVRSSPSNRAKPPPASSNQPRPRNGEPDLAQAYALRARTEREERERAQREAEQRGREKRERKEKLARLLDGKALNAADAEHPRHFPHGGKIRRVYCTEQQLAAVNRGEIVILQQNGRYLLVEQEIARQAETISAEALVLRVDPNAPAEDDVPADLIW